MNAALQGGPKDTSALKDARDNLVAALHQTAAYIQSLNLTKAQMLAQGFDVAVYNNTKTTLVTQLIPGLGNSNTTQLGVALQR